MLQNLLQLPKLKPSLEQPPWYVPFSGAAKWVQCNGIIPFSIWGTSSWWWSSGAALQTRFFANDEYSSRWFQPIVCEVLKVARELKIIVFTIKSWRPIILEVRFMPKCIFTKSHVAWIIRFHSCSLFLLQVICTHFMMPCDAWCAWWAMHCKSCHDMSKHALLPSYPTKIPFCMTWHHHFHPPSTHYTPFHSTPQEDSVNFKRE